MTPAVDRLQRQVGLRALQGFAEIMRTGSATAAGRVVGLSQSAVSRLILQLEADIGFELFYRDKGRLIPTKEGTALYEEVELALAGVARVHGLIRDIANNATGELRLIAPPSFAEGVLPGVIAAFSARYPGVRVAVDSRSIATTKTMLVTRVADCAFMRLPIDRDDLIAETVVSSDSVCVLREDHPLAAAETITAEMLKGVPIIMLGAGVIYGQQIEGLFRERGVRPTVVAECHTTGAACALASHGIGITIVNELLSRAHIRTPLVSRRFEPALAHDYAIVMSAKTRPSRLMEAFKLTVHDYFASGSPA